MLLIVVVVFLAVFALFVLVMMAARGGSTSPETVRATLDSVLLKTSRPASEEIIDVRKNVALSSIPWMDRLLAHMRPAAELRRVLAQADLAWTPGRVFLTGVAVWLGAIYVIQLKTGTTLGFSALLASPAAATPFLYVLKKRQRRFDRFQEKLPDAIDLMVSALRAGNSTMGALGIAAGEAPEPIRREFRTCFDEQCYGVDLRAALENLFDRVPLPDMRIIITAILIQKESGGNLAEVLDKTAHVIRDRFRLRDQIRVHSAQGRLTGWILSVLPAGMGVLLFLLNPKYISILLTSPVGHKLMAAAAAMNLLGLLVIRKIVRIKV
jgi:tight adherence protein B